MRSVVAAAAILLVVLIPGAASQTTLFLGAEVQVEQLLDARSMRVRVPAQDSTPLERPCEGDPSRFEVDAAGAWFRFDTRGKTNACAEALFEFDVPPGASSARVAFMADRLVEQQQAVPLRMRVDFVQALRTYADGVFQSSHLVFAREASTQAETRFAFEEPVRGGPFHVAWHFEDRSANPAVPTLEQSLAARVRGAHVTFQGIALEPASIAVHRPGLGATSNAEQVVVKLMVEAPLAGQACLVLRTSPLLRLSGIAGPDGALLPLDAVSVRQEDGIATTRLESWAVARHGYGEYTITFTSAVVVSPDAWLPVAVGASLLLPGVLAVIAVQQWLHLRRQMRGRYAARPYLWPILGATALYVASLAWIAWPGSSGNLLAWPLERSAVLLGGTLYASAFALLGASLAAKGRMVRLVKSEASEKERANLELARSNRDLEQFAYVASHDLQEPLRAVAGYTQLLERRYGDRLDDQGRQYVRNAVEGAQRMQGLIQGLLAYARIGTESTPRTAVDLEHVLQEALSNLESAVRSTSARITHGRLPVVQADRQQLVQLLQNLLANAMKFSKRAPRIRVQAQPRGREWVVEVYDNGIGVPPEQARNIFQLFHRLHPRDAYGGSGMGLAVCQRIVERHGGAIWVEPNPGGGSVFRFTLPMQGQAL
jgi:signal transduction histidine kinase